MMKISQTKRIIEVDFASAGNDGDAISKLQEQLETEVLLEIAGIDFAKISGGGFDSSQSGITANNPKGRPKKAPIKMGYYYEVNPSE